MADSHPPLKIDSIVQVTLLEKFGDRSHTRRGLYSIKGPGQLETTYTSETIYPKGHSFNGRLTGSLYNENGVSYFRVTDPKGKEWYLSTRSAEIAPVRVPEPPNGEDGVA